ncbi:spike base protein, RCAP_Rcc01079 family [Sphingomonas corticis]|uniref:spike base protein, RCAP_Rcc01079 family n=1 Tax=Sphingomonas corticis TaxID=2722791 RepID=UPI001EF02CD5|nr:hypothetical protein [Sphingomonas corticis]
MPDLITPVPDATPIGELIGGKLHGYVILRDANGADILGLLTATPAANTIGARLKAIADNTDGLEGFVDGIEALITATNAALTTLNGYNDAVEQLLGTNNSTTALTAPADDLFAIVPSDTVDLATVPKALYCAVAGNVALRGTGNTTITIPVVAGQIVPIRARRVMATGTTATMVGLA